MSPGPVLALVEHDRGVAAETAWQVLGLAGAVADQTGAEVHAVLVGAEADGLARSAAGQGAGAVWLVHHPLLTDYCPEAWAAAMVALAGAQGASAVVATATDRGNEVLAHVAAATDLPFAANVTELAADPDGWRLSRLRWGGSLLEDATLTAPLKVLSGAPHAFAPPPASDEPSAAVVFSPDLPEDAARTRIVGRVAAEAGSTLASAPVVVSGGRGVGSPEGFALLEELAALLGGAVGCSRVVTNNGWRPHSDQVGQTGKRIAPDLYIACGISGAIQHWVGMMAAKRVLAVNTDVDAPMVTKADHAVVGDLHAVLPAVIAEIHRRRGDTAP